ncbi:MAG: 50S ribosomal protein L9 [Saprospiraceae bacterium]|nr:50S ribosomal protein L9 [Saprospiraceae bacterium]
MKVILLKDLDKVGDKHTIVSVKNGYGRNFLIPRGLALIANESNKKRLQDLRNREGREEAKKLGLYQEMAASLKGKTLKIAAKAGTTGKIFGSVNELQLSQAIKEQFQMEIPRKKIEILEDVKNLGSYKAKLTLHPEVVSEIDFEVEAG